MMQGKKYHKVALRPLLQGEVQKPPRYGRNTQPQSSNIVTNTGTTKAVVKFIKDRQKFKKDSEAETQLYGYTNFKPR